MVNPAATRAPTTQIGTIALPVSQDDLMTFWQNVIEPFIKAFPAQGVVLTNPQDHQVLGALAMGTTDALAVLAERTQRLGQNPSGAESQILDFLQWLISGKQDQIPVDTLAQHFITLGRTLLNSGSSNDYQGLLNQITAARHDILSPFVTADNWPDDHDTTKETTLRNALDNFLQDTGLYQEMSAHSPKYRLILEGKESSVTSEIREVIAYIAHCDLRSDYEKQALLKKLYGEIRSDSSKYSQLSLENIRGRVSQLDELEHQQATLHDSVRTQLYREFLLIAGSDEEKAQAMISSVGSENLNTAGKTDDMAFSLAQECASFRTPPQPRVRVRPTEDPSIVDPRNWHLYEENPLYAMQYLVALKPDDCDKSNDRTRYQLAIELDAKPQQSLTIKQILAQILEKPSEYPVEQDLLIVQRVEAITDPQARELFYSILQSKEIIHH